MSGELDGIVSVTITRATKTVEQASFDTVLIVVDEDLSTGPQSTRTAEYGSLTELTDAGFVETDPAYLHAQKFLSQNPNPGTFKIGIKDTGDASYTAAMNAILAYDQDWYGLVIESDTFSDQKLVADWAETQTVLFFAKTTDDDVIDVDTPTAGYAEISNTGALGTFTGATVPGIATQSDYELDITVDGTAYQLADISVNIADDWTTIVAAIETSIQNATSSSETCALVDGKIKVTSATTGESSTIVIAAGTAGTGSGDLLGVIDALGADYATNLDSPVDGKEDIANYAEDNSYDRTAVYYHNDSDEDYIDIAALGEAMPYDPGSQTWSFKTLSGVVAYSLTTAQFNRAVGKNCNVYTSKAGNSITQWGTVGSGEYIDVIRGIDWTIARIQERVFGAQINNRKVPYTDAGIQLIVGEVKGVLYEGADNDLYIRDTIEITYPERSETSSADRAARTLNDVDFSADLAGAIHITNITGKVSA